MNPSGNNKTIFYVSHPYHKPVSISYFCLTLIHVYHIKSLMETKISNRERIIDTAIALFNESGSHSSTTNFICETMDISPGNLYYHFKNKQEIVREIFLRITSEFDALWNMSFDHPITSAYFDHLITTSSAIYYSYRFFYLELPSLIAQDPILKKIYITNQTQKIKKTVSFLKVLSDNKIMIPDLTEKERNALLECSWVLFDFRLSYLFISGKKITIVSIREGIFSQLILLKPFLTERGRQIFGYSS